MSDDTRPSDVRPLVRREPTTRHVTCVRLDRPPNKYSWQTWTAAVEFPQAGYYEIWSRATDEKGDMQPFAVAWNPKGYLSNVMHRVHVTVT